MKGKDTLRCFPVPAAATGTNRFERLFSQIAQRQISAMKNLEAKAPAAAGGSEEERKRERLSKRPVASLTRPPPPYNGKGSHRLVIGKVTGDTIIAQLDGKFLKRLAGRGLSKGFKGILVRAGLDPTTVKGKGVRNFSKRSFHSLSHSFNSEMANAGVAEEMRMKLMGHARICIIPK